MEELEELIVQRFLDGGEAREMPLEPGDKRIGRPLRPEELLKTEGIHRLDPQGAHGERAHTAKLDSQ